MRADEHRIATAIVAAGPAADMGTFSDVADSFRVPAKRYWYLRRKWEPDLWDGLTVFEAAQKRLRAAGRVPTDCGSVRAGPPKADL